MTEYAVEAIGLRKTYAPRGGQPAKEALKGVDLRIPTGSIFGLLGPNGAGKSTFINILAGLVVKTEGSVTIWGFDQDVNPRMSRASIGVVPQELNIDPFLRPYETLEVQAGLYGVPSNRRRTQELLEAMGLADKARAYARSLSGGMRRRLLVCKAMVHDPPVLVLDEPTAGVDIELRQQLWDYVKQLNDKGVTVILTTHYLEEAEAMCDRVAIIDQGAVKASATTQELLSTIDRKTVVLRPANRLASTEAFAAALPATARLERREDGAVAVRYRRRETPLSAILSAAQAAGIEIADLTTEEPDLEEVFLEITGGGRGDPNIAGASVREGGE